VNRIRIIVRSIISGIIVRYAEKLGILERNVSQVKGLIREVSATIKLNIGRDVKRRDVKGRNVKRRDVKGRDVKGKDVKESVNTERIVKKIIDKIIKTVQGIIETLEKKIIKVLKAKITEVLVSIKA
jgi:predicted transcriptional regulator